MTLDRISFACFFERWQELLGISLHPDIVGAIYEHYESYSLLKLIRGFKEKVFEIDKQDVSKNCIYILGDII